jgi:hypothetical protein
MTLPTESLEKILEDALYAVDAESIENDEELVDDAKDPALEEISRRAAAISLAIQEYIEAKLTQYGVERSE